MVPQNEYALSPWKTIVMYSERSAYFERDGKTTIDRVASKTLKHSQRSLQTFGAFFLMLLDSEI